MYIAMQEQELELPFSLEIKGTRWGNLFQVPNGTNSRPFVRPDSVSLETSADEIGGTLTFEVEQIVTVAPVPLTEISVGLEDGPWWSEANLPDNAVVEFREGRLVNPVLGAKTRIFVGFIDAIDVVPNPTGTGTIATITCVSTNVLLDRIIVRKPMRGKAAQRRGQTTGSFMVKRGSDRNQIRQILRYAGVKRSYGDLTLFDPTNHKQVYSTYGSLPAAGSPRLPKLEVPVGTLREALEMVMEAAQQADGRRRAFHIDPQTSSLFYGFADSSAAGELSFALQEAPFSITDDPADEDIANALTGSMYDVIDSLDPVISFSMRPTDENAFPFGSNSSPVRNRVASRPILALGSGSTEPSPYIGQSGGKFITGNISVYDRELFADSPAAAAGGHFSLSMWVSRNAGISIGGDDGVTVQAVDGALFPAYANTWQVTVDGVTYQSNNPANVATDGAWHHLVFTMDNSGIPFTTGLYVNGVKANNVNDYWGPAPTQRIRLFRSSAYGTEAGTFGPVAIFGRKLTDAEIAKLYAAGTPPQAGGKLLGRDLRLSLDHSRVAKIGVFLAADSKSDRDNDPDPYVRKYDALLGPTTRETVEWVPGGPAGAEFRYGTTKRIFDRRRGPRFESLVEASTVRTGTPLQRSRKIDRLARGYFAARRLPEIGATVSIRGAGSAPGQEYGFASGWAPVDEVGSTERYVSWKPGQIVTIHSRALGFTGDQDEARYPMKESRGVFRIVSVVMTFEPGSFIRRFDLTLGRRPRSTIASLIVAE